MSKNATLHFLPWMRRGLARAIATPASEGLPARSVGPVELSVRVEGQTITQAVQLRGPGEVVGLSPGQIVRCEPSAGTQDFEPNYFPSVELATPDLPWMFTPASPDANGRLIPWLVLVVVEVQAGVSLTRRGGAQLRVLTIEAPALPKHELPPLTEAWAWAHVQTSADLDSQSVAQAYAASPESCLARLVCPRRLREGRSYLACLVPSFRAGQRAGLGYPVEHDDVTLAWGEEDQDQDHIELPVYHSWRFRTGPDGDFEALVRRLSPRELEAGTHDLDIGEPGSESLPTRPGMLVSFNGALVSPAAKQRNWKRIHQRNFQRGLETLLDAALAANAGAAQDPDAPDYDPLVDDPVVAPPAYGTLPTGLDDIPKPLRPGRRPSRAHLPRWLAEVNLDPKHRAAAGLGAEVVRREQESLMAQAWEQAASLREINQLLNRTRLAAEVGGKIKANKIETLSKGATLQLTRNAHARLEVREAASPKRARAKTGSRAARGRSVAGTLAATSVPAALMSAAFKRTTRVGGTLGRGLGAAPKPISSKITAGFVNRLPVAMRFAAFVQPPGCQIDDPDAFLAMIPGYEADKDKGSAKRQARRADPRKRTIAGQRLSSEATVASPRASSSLGQPVSTLTRGKLPGRSAVDVNTRSGGVELSELAGVVKQRLDVTGTLAAKLADRIQAPAQAWRGRELPSRMRAAPSFPTPLYRALRELDPEFLLPGVGEIPDDSVGLTEVNAAFVEAFLLGANHELAREFMWREYPAELTDTWLRTFWDALEAAEPGGDIRAIAAWNKRKLGTHQIGAGADGTLALILKGQLLRRYPDTRIYAVKARWSQDRSAREEDTGNTGATREPLFVGALDRSTVFLGFDLSVEAANGAPEPGGDAGWFFVFEQAPTGPRFGLDVARHRHAGRVPRFWANLSWGHQLEAGEALEDLHHAEARGRLAGQARRYDRGKFRAIWGQDASAMAQITLQRPVRMLVHASAMLPDGAVNAD